MTTSLAHRLALLTASPATLIAATRDRIGGSRLAALRTWMHETDARCVSCGYATRLDVPSRHPRHAELGHLIAASTYAPSNARVGFIPGNIGLMCHTCNADANKADMTFGVSDLLHPELVPLAWPVLKGTTAGSDNETEESRKARKW